MAMPALAAPLGSGLAVAWACALVEGVEADVIWPALMALLGWVGASGASEATASVVGMPFVFVGSLMTVGMAVVVFLADSRVVVASLDGEEADDLGSGRRGEPAPWMVVGVALVVRSSSSLMVL